MVSNLSLLYSMNRLVMFLHTNTVGQHVNLMYGGTHALAYLSTCALCENATNVC